MFIISFLMMKCKTTSLWNETLAPLIGWNSVLWINKYWNINVGKITFVYCHNFHKIKKNFKLCLESIIWRGLASKRVEEAVNGVFTPKGWSWQRVISWFPRIFLFRNDWKFPRICRIFSSIMNSSELVGGNQHFSISYLWSVRILFFRWFSMEKWLICSPL